MQGDLGVVYHTYNPSTREREIRELIAHEFEASVVYIVGSKPAKNKGWNSVPKEASKQNKMQGWACETTSGVRT